MSRLAFVAVILSGVTSFVFAIALTLGAVVLNSRMHPQKKERVVAPAPGPLVAIPDQVYNLGEPNRYLKAALVLEMAVDGRSVKETASFTEEMKKREPQLRDIVIRVINGRTFLEVNSPRGKAEMKEAIRKEVNKVLARGEIKTVLFTNFAVQ